MSPSGKRQAGSSAQRTATAPSGDTSRARMVQAGKTLFARLGYENTPTSTLAREAGTSESQLVRAFGGKAGLLEAILEESWKPLNAGVADLLADAGSALCRTGRGDSMCPSRFAARQNDPSGDDLAMRRRLG